MTVSPRNNINPREYARLSAFKGYADSSILVPVLDTSAYASGDNLFDLLTVPIPFSTGINTSATLTGVTTTLLNDSTPIQIDLIFFDSPVTLAAKNAPFTLSDANAAKIIGILPIVTGNFIALQAAANQVGFTSTNQILEPVDGRSFYVAGIVRAAPTLALGDLLLRFHLRNQP